MISRPHAPQPSSAQSNRERSDANSGHYLRCSLFAQNCCYGMVPNALRQPETEIVERSVKHYAVQGIKTVISHCEPAVETSTSPPLGCRPPLLLRSIGR